MRLYIIPYLEILTRNQREMRGRCIELVELHEEYLPFDSSIYKHREFVDLGVEEKINALYELWDAATNKENAERDAHSGHISKDMHGRVKNIYQTYDYLDNDKYKRIELLLDIMQETFGFGIEDEEDDEIIVKPFTKFNFDQDEEDYKLRCAQISREMVGDGPRLSE